MNKVKLSLIVLVCMSTKVFAGSLEPPAGPDDPASAMYTIEAIYQRLLTGTNIAKRTGAFTEPTAAPGPTMHDMNEVMAVAPSNVVTDFATTNEVLAGQIFWGLTTNEWGTLSGTMPDQGAVTYTPGTTDQAVAKGYHNGSGKVEGDSSLVTTNIKKDVSIFGVTGTVYEAAVPKTGQTNEYGMAPYDVDGYLQKGIAWPIPRFTSNDQWTVTDNLTGLMWTRDANIPGGTVGWTNALKYCVTNMNVGAGYGGYTNWHLPNAVEMCSLLHWGFQGPALSDATGTNKWTEARGPFTGVQSGSYWTGATYAGTAVYAWHVGMGSADVNYAAKTRAYYVWPVRGGE